MSKEPSATDQPEAVEPERPFLSAAWPFLVAVAIIIVALLAIVIMHVVKPGSERLTDSAKITRTLNDYYSSISEVKYDRYRSTFCPQDTQLSSFPTAQQFTDKYQAIRDKNGQIKMEDPSEVTVNGDVATANSHWAYTSGDTSNHTDAMKFFKDGDDWNICNSIQPGQK
ncbi:Rv0361 family membrane protein [Jongsikchunia kroppenstedtii]|uniref:Rv0361 family membrane protein n=1 Tax=Jongsikchunia kroppenstedtii TaxID=1121721 RepID=UPI00036BF0E3|nr:hypothetical protein [Jongsikchunia kroppenstedtii]